MLVFSDHAVINTDWSEQKKKKNQALIIYYLMFYGYVLEWITQNWEMWPKAIERKTQHLASIF